MMWKQRKWAKGVEESYSHLVYAVLEDARSRNNNAEFSTLKILSLT
jgi:hypothetical protein